MSLCKICKEEIFWHQDRVTRDLMETSIGKVVPCKVHTLCIEQMGFEGLVKDLYERLKKISGPYFN